jgi:ribosome-associated protein
MTEFELKTEYIELNKLLKILNWVESGGQANNVIEQGMVEVNGHTELRKRNKLREGDLVVFEGNRAKIIITSK